MVSGLLAVHLLCGAMLCAQPNTAQLVSARCSNGVPLVRTDEGQGTGFLINKEGYVLTNRHVADRGDDVEVTFEKEPGHAYRAYVVRTHPRYDISLLRIEGFSFIPHLHTVTS